MFDRASCLTDQRAKNAESGQKQILKSLVKIDGDSAKKTVIVIKTKFIQYTPLWEKYPLQYNIFSASMWNEIQRIILPI